MQVGELFFLEHLVGEHANLVVFEKYAGLLIPQPSSMLHYVLAMTLDAILLAFAKFAVGMAAFAQIVDHVLGEHLLGRGYIIFVAAMLIRRPVAILATHIFLVVNGHIPFLVIVVELLGGDEEIWVAVAFDAGVCHLGCGFFSPGEGFCEEQQGERQRDRQENRAS